MRLTRTRVTNTYQLKRLNQEKKSKTKYNKEGIEDLDILFKLLE